MKHLGLPVLLCGFLAACTNNGSHTNPFQQASADSGSGGSGDGTTSDSGITSDRTLPPGSTSPTPSDAVFRYEPKDAETGSGFAEAPSYDAGTDTFTVDNLAFDGANTYDRGTVVASLGPYAVYEGETVVTDPVSGATVPQFTYRAIYGVSGSGNTEFAIIRTGSYTGYGFGGFVYQRNGGVVLPSGGQAIFNGEYAALRDFNGKGGIEYVTGQAQVLVDFDDFNAGPGAVTGTISGRRVFDMAGADVTDDLLTLMETEFEGSYTELPTLVFAVSEDTLDANGEAVGTLSSSIVDGDGNTVTYESGNFYAVLSGDLTQDDPSNPGEVVGIIVVTSDFSKASFSARETGGFIATR